MRFLLTHNTDRILNIDHVRDIKRTDEGLFATTTEGYLWRLADHYTLEDIQRKTDAR